MVSKMVSGCAGNARQAETAEAGFMQRLRRRAKHGVAAAAAFAFFRFASPALAETPVACNSASLNRNGATGKLLRYSQVTFYEKQMQSEGDTTARQDGVLATVRKDNLALALSWALEQALGENAESTPDKQSAFAGVAVSSPVEGIGSMHAFGGANVSWTTPSTVVSTSPEIGMALDASGKFPLYATVGSTPVSNYVMANVGVGPNVVFSGKAQYGQETHATDYALGADFIWRFGNGKVHFFASAGGNSENDAPNVFNEGARLFFVPSRVPGEKPWWFEVNATQRNAVAPGGKDSQEFSILFSAPLE